MKNKKIGNVGKSRPSEILKWNIFQKKGELELKKMKMKIFDFLSKIAITFKI